MNELNRYESREVAAHEKIIDAHKFLLIFLGKFETAKRGGIHDFMEISLFNMVNSAIKAIDEYLESGHKTVSATEIMHIVIENYQKVLDGMKRNMENMIQVNFE